MNQSLNFKLDLKLRLCCGLEIVGDFLEILAKIITPGYDIGHQQF